MRRVLVPILAVPLAGVLAPPVSALDKPPLRVQSSVQFATATDDDDDDRSYRTTALTFVNACPEAEAEDNYSFDCRVKITVRKNGKKVVNESTEETYQAAAYFGDAYDDTNNDEDDPNSTTDSYFSRDWASCKRSGRYTYVFTSVSDLRDGTNPDGSTKVVPNVTRTVGGSFRIPKCKKQKPRKVSAQTAAEYVREALPDDEFVSQLRCGSGYKSVFRCRVRRNNEYRECVSVETIRFYRTDRFGFKDNSNKVSYGKDRCRSF